MPQTVFDKGYLTMSIRLEDFESVDDEHSQMVIDLLTACDDEFVPPLSSRHSTTQRELESVIANTAGITTVIVGAVIEYFDDMRRHPIVLAVDEGDDGERLVGFVSYIRDYRLDFIDEPVTYVSTICVDKRRRKHGTASRLYERLEDIVHSQGGGVIALRTWSTNAAHCRLLDKLGYGRVKRIPDDRMPHVDTLYFAKRVE